MAEMTPREQRPFIVVSRSVSNLVPARQQFTRASLRRHGDNNNNKNNKAQKSSNFNCIFTKSGSSWYRPHDNKTKGRSTWRKQRPVTHSRSSGAAVGGTHAGIMTGSVVGRPRAAAYTSNKPLNKNLISVFPAIPPIRFKCTKALVFQATTGFRKSCNYILIR